jgi:formylglycine-generating enzyme required for sulfatase activity
MLDRPQANQFVKDVNELSSSEDPAIQALLLRIIPDHKPGDVYDLPTEAQWAFVARNRGKNYKDYFDRDDSSLVPDYAWVGVNSGDHTHAVGTRKPRVLDEQVYYDIEGNVMVWSKDRDAGYGGKDPIGKINSPYALALGSYFSSTGLATNIMKKFDMMDHDAKRPWLGLRLIRKLPQKKNFLQKLWGR